MITTGNNSPLPEAASKLPAQADRAGAHSSIEGYEARVLRTSSELEPVRSAWKNGRIIRTPASNCLSSLLRRVRKPRKPPSWRSSVAKFWRG